MDNYGKRRLTICIDGESAEGLFAVGIDDLKNYFLPENFGVATGDVESIIFTQCKLDENGNELPLTVFGGKKWEYDRAKKPNK